MTTPNSNAPDAALSGLTSSNPTLQTGNATVDGLPAPSQDQIDRNVLTNIDPTTPPEMKTMVYSPDVRIYIARGNKQYDVSNDVVAWSIRRVENGVSSAVFRLSNKANDTAGKKLRYHLLFERMDRVVIWLKRVEWVMVFSGYLDSVPHVQLYPGTVNFRASCTLKRLMHTWWDPGLPTSDFLFDQAGTSQRELENGEEQPDQGLGSLLRRLLIEVGGWKQENIHIQRFPIGFFQYMERQLQKLTPGAEAAVRDFKELLLGEGDISMGVGKAAGRQIGVSMGGYSLSRADRMAEVIRTVDEMGMGPLVSGVAAGEGTAAAAQGGKDQRDQPGWQGLQEVGKNWSQAARENDAAIHCFMTIETESHWNMYANRAVPESLGYPYDPGFISTDGSSVGLYQQQNYGEWGSVAQRMNVKASTQMFLQHLQKLDWRNMPRAAACQAVQRSKFSDGSNYLANEQVAIDLVQSIRKGTGTGGGAGGQNSGNPVPGTNLGGTPLESALTPSLPGTLGTPAAGIPTSNGTPSAAAAPSALPAAGQPQFNTAGALSCARFMIGRPYNYGSKGPEAFDCSGLTQFAYRSIGMEIGTNTTAQKENTQPIPWTNLVPGDLIFPAESDHVVMYAGGNMIVEAADYGIPVRETAINFNPLTAVCRHVPGAEYGGAPFAPFDLTKAMSNNNASAGTVTTGLNGSTASIGHTEPIARNLFAYQFSAGQFANAISTEFGGEKGQEEKAFINDEPLIQTVISFAQAGLRNFQSAPNGDFIAYYPDYFGLDGKDAQWNIHDIEMKNVQIDLNDDAMATHVYVSGSALPNGAGAGGVMGWLNSKGVATVENEWLFKQMAAAAPHVPGERMRSGKDIMARFGARPLVQSMSSVQQGPMEWLLAVQTFMKKWAEQYSTQIDITFMPEIFPGMRVNLVEHNLQAYVAEVTHSGDFENGFTTTMTIMAPSNPNLKNMGTSIFNPVIQEATNFADLIRQAATVIS